MPRVPDQLDRWSVPSFVHAYGKPRDPLLDLLPEKPPLSIHDSGSRYGTGMGYAFTYAIGFQTKAFFVLKLKRNRPWIFYRWLRNRDFWFNPGRQRPYKCFDNEFFIYRFILTMITRLRFYLRSASLAQVDLVAGAAVALPVVPIPIC